MILSEVVADYVTAIYIDNRSRDEIAGGQIIGRFGNITAKAFFQLGLDSLDTYPGKERALYDRAALTLY